MSKKYMDFVPVKTVGGGAKANTRNVSSRPNVLMPESGATPRTRMARREASRLVSTKRVTPQKTMVQTATRQASVVREGIIEGGASAGIVGGSERFSIQNNIKLGEIEDLSPKFVKTDVPKRPLSRGTDARKKSATEELAEAKSKKFRSVLRGRNASEKSSKKADGVFSKSNEVYVPPRSPFINQDKVAKRPLSKNVYQKEIKPTEEKLSKAPVTIIAKPEKESRAGLVIAIILTIILGAVAGTLAFLLLPK